ncbi:MAG TPA: glycosyltransferase family 4 protein [Bryobacteraceae bacterium]|nr:glycosyltransferase family 4 protein [Bryobacteraceae bacterium]
MKVLLTHERFPPDFGGGGEYIVEGTARYLAQRGVDVTVVTTGDPAQNSHSGIPIIRMPVSRYRMNLATGRIAELARGVELIQTFNYHACLPSLIAGRRHHKPVVLLLLGLFGETWKEMKGPVAGKAFLAWEKFLMRRSFSRFLFLSEYSRKMGIEFGAPPDRSLVNTYGLDTAYFHPAPEKEPYVLFAGKLDIRKGVYDLLAAAKELPQVKFKILGWGPEEQAMRAAATTNVEFLGFDQGELRRQTLAAASIFVLPSRAEGLPVALMEAMAAGCAVVCTLPFEYEGARVPVGDRAQLTSALARLWSDPRATRRMGEENRRTAEAFTWDRYIDVLLDVYAGLLNGAGQ